MLCEIIHEVFSRESKTKVSFILAENLGNYCWLCWSERAWDCSGCWRTLKMTSSPATARWPSQSVKHPTFSTKTDMVTGWWVSRITDSTIQMANSCNPLNPQFRSLKIWRHCTTDFNLRNCHLHLVILCLPGHNVGDPRGFIRSNPKSGQNVECPCKVRRGCVTPS